ncbi:porin [Rahnella victoriana]|uniref:carbohydrate porin n=1 Tax=Rahnella victoriana TaxID=1510570 RepID=UPI000BB1B74E|nr:porin [Rahnella victoriana]
MKISQTSATPTTTPVNNNIRLLKNSLLALCFTTASIYSAQAAENWNGTVLGFEAPGEGMFGDMMGIRPIIEDHGFHYQLGYLSESSYNAGGGYNHDKHLAYIDQFSLTFTQDLEMYTGIPDAAIEGNIVNRNHNDNLTTKRTQDPRVGINDIAQESWGGQSITRLGWLTFGRSFDDRKLHWRIGMMNKNQDFDQIIPCDFQLLSQCGGKSANSMTWYNWNKHYWGTTIQYKLTPELTLKTGIMEQNPDASDRKYAWSGSLKGARGILLPMEAELKTKVNGLPGIYNLGLLYTNSPQTDLSEGKTQSVGATDPEGYRKHSSTWFMYTGFNQQVTQRGDDPNRGMSVSYSLGLGDQRSNSIHYTQAASMRYRGLFDARPDDWLGFGMTYIKMSNHYRQNQENLNDIYQVDNYGNPLYTPLSGHSVNADLYYQIKVRSWLILQPDLQYWYRPGGVKETQDAWVTGLKAIVTF